MAAELIIKDNGACWLAGCPLHPPRGAMAAAREELAGVLEGLGPDDTLVLAGLGLGWHAKAILEGEGGPGLVAFEPDARRRALMFALGPPLPGLCLVGDENGLCEELGRRLVYERPGRVEVFTPPAYARAAPEVAAAAREQVRRSLERRQSNQVTVEVHQARWRRHIVENFKYVLEVPDLCQLAGALAGVPALVVGAGPSLDQSLEYLAGVEDKALVLAAASALGPLAGVGVYPHLAVALEAKDESRQFRGADTALTALAAATASNPRHFSQWGGQMGLFHLQPWLARLAGGGSALATGGHATSAAFSLAILWGCDPIILVGQDLAYTGGRIHASGRPGGEEDGLPELVPVPAIDGSVAGTSLVMQSYITWYQEAAAYLARRQGERRVINATAQGAYIPGFEHQPLERVLAELESCPLERGDFSRALAGLPRPPDYLLAQRLGQARAEIRGVLNRLNEQGVEAARRAAPEDSPARAALEQPPETDDRDTLKQRLEEMARDLRRMAEALYG